MDLRDLFKILISFSNLNAAKIADLAGVKRPNLYTWQSGKSQALSEGNIESIFNILGVIKGKLSSEIVYRWKIDFDEAQLKNVLQQFVNQQILNQSEIYFIEIDGYTETDSKKYSLIHIPHSTGAISILISGSTNQSVGFPIKSTKLGFGKDCQKVNISSEQWANWWSVDVLSSINFWTEFSLYLSNSNMNATSSNELQDVDQVAAFKNIIIEKTAENAGLRAIIRSLMRELGVLKPNHQLLKKENRNLIYKEFYEHENSKIRKDK